MREAAETKTRKMAVGASRVVEVMETTNLPKLQKEWMVEDAHKAKKMIACVTWSVSDPAQLRKAKCNILI